MDEFNFEKTCFIINKTKIKRLSNAGIAELRSNDVVTLNEPNRPCEEFPATSIGSNEVSVHVVEKNAREPGSSVPVKVLVILPSL